MYEDTFRRVWRGVRSVPYDGEFVIIPQKSWSIFDDTIPPKVMRKFYTIGMIKI